MVGTRLVIPVLHQLWAFWTAANKERQHDSHAVFQVVQYEKLQMYVSASSPAFVAFVTI